MQELASQSLELVNRELTSTLETARGEIEDYVDGQSDSEALVRAASLLHIAAGALKIVEIHGAALLAEEMEQTCRAIHEARGETSDRGVESLTRAMVQLPAYLDRLMSGGSDVALVLLPLLNDLRAARGQPMLSEGTLLLLNTGPFERFRKAKARGATKAFGNKLPALAQKIRPKFQAALLKWIRGEGSQQHLKELIEASDALEAAAESEPARQLWSVTAGVLVALRTGALEPSVQLKRLLGQADRQLKRLIDSGEQSFVSQPPVDLLNSLLYYVARAPGEEPRLVELRRSFGVETVIPDAAEIEQAREDLAGPSVKLMRTVAEAIREDLAGVKDVLDIFVRTGMEDQTALKPQLDMLKKIGDTLGVLGLESARNRIQAESAALNEIVAKGSVGDARAFERIAASLLEVEDVLDRELVKAHGRESEEAKSGTDEALDSTQYRHVTQAVMRECIVNLAKIKEAVVKVLDDPGAIRALDQIGPQLRGIVAGLLMLNKNKAVNVIERIGRNVTTRLAPGAGNLKPSLIERLADAIVSIEYYMETLALGRADPNYMLDNANRCLDLVEGAAAKAAAGAATPEPEAEAAPEPELDATAAEEELPPAALKVMEVDEERSEPELVEVFIEEAKDEVDRIRELLPRWIDEPTDSEALIGVRRSFHTLKGSGRVVGAQLLGEFAWSVENLLNRVINQTLRTDPAMLEFIREAADTLPALIEQLEIGIRPAQDIDAMIARAHAFAEGREDRDTAIEAQPPIAAEAAESGMDPVLLNIFTKEVREHLATIRAFVTQAASATPPVPITEPLHRACHTLHGSARMAALAPAIALAEPLEQRIRAGFEGQRGLAGAAIATLGRFAVEIERLTAELEAGQTLAPDPGVVEAVRALELAAPEDAASATGYLQEISSASGEFESPVLVDPDATGLLPAELSLIEDEPEEIVLESGDEELAAGFESGEITLESSGFDRADDESSGIVLVEEPEAATQPEVAAGSAGEAAAVADYDPEIAAIFCDEASELLDQAETEFARLKQSTGSDSALAELKRLLHTLKGGARLAGIVAMGDLSHALETMLPKLAASSTGADSAGMRLAQQAFDCLQQMRDAVDAGHGVIAARELVRSLEQFGVAPAAAAPQPAAAPPKAAAPAAAAPPKPAAPAAAAPPKHAAPAAPAPPPAAKAPPAAPPSPPAGDETRVQPAIDFEVPADTGSALDIELAAGAPDEAPLEIGAPADDETRRQPKLGTEAPAAPTRPVAPAAAAPAASGPAKPAVPAAPKEAATAPPPAAAAQAPAVEPPPAGPPVDQTLAVGGARAERAETARVDAVLLDELLNGAGEISIFQSRLNQQVHSIEFHLGELAQTVTRLREQLRSLEAETEAQILHRHQGDLDADQHFDPLELDRYSTIQQLSRALAETSNDVASINELLQGLTSEADTLLTQQSRVTTQLQDGLMQTRMVTFDRQSTRLARIVRQAAQDTGKEAELVIDGAKSQLDRQILEAIVPALEHLLRNAVVHGIEAPATRAAAGKAAAGEIELSVRREGSEVLIEVADDGAGLDLKAIRRKAVEKGLIRDGDSIGDDEVIELILLPGFSTADELTQAAGRGVGMDVVDNEIKRLGGSLRILTETGKGTRFLIRLPYTLAITHALIVVVGDETFALPLPTVEGIARVRREQLLDLLTEDDPKLAHGDASYRIQHLGSLVGSAPSALPEDESAVSLVLVRAGENSTALLTDSLEGSREIVVKTLGAHISSVAGVTGATILGDGRVVVILDAGTLVRSQHGELKSSAPAAEARPLTALVVDDSITMRRVTQRLLERRGVKVHTARDGLDAIEVLREHEADIILLDIEMPRMDGYQFATHVRNDARFKDTPIIMVTSRSGEKHRARAIEIGVNDYLSKPYQEAELMHAIGALVGRKL